MMPLGVVASARTPPAAGGSLTATFLQFTTLSGGDTAAVSIAGVNLGAAAADRTIIIIMGQWTSPTMTSATIGGQAVTWDISRSTNPHLYIGRASVPSGTTGTVALNWTGNVSPVRSGFALYRVTGGAVAVSDTGVAGPSASPSTTVTVPTGGFMVAGSYVYGSGCSWSGITEDFDQALGIMSISGGDSTTVGDVTVAPTWTTINSNPYLGAVAYGPA